MYEIFLVGTTIRSLTFSYYRSFSFRVGLIAIASTMRMTKHSYRRTAIIICLGSLSTKKE